MDEMEKGDESGRAIACKVPGGALSTTTKARGYGCQIDEGSGWCDENHYP